MTHISHRDALNQVFEDKELVEYLSARVSDFKTYGAFRVDPLPFHVVVALIDKVKSLMEQQTAFYNNGRVPPGGTADNDDDFEAQNPPDAPL